MPHDSFLRKHKQAAGSFAAKKHSAKEILYVGLNQSLLPVGLITGENGSNFSGIVRTGRMVLELS